MDNIKLMPPLNQIQQIAYLTVLPSYYPSILSEYEQVSPGAGKKIWEILCIEISHLEESYKKWLTFNSSADGWTSHLQKCGYKIP